MLAKFKGRFVALTSNIHPDVSAGPFHAKSKVIHRELACRIMQCVLSALVFACAVVFWSFIDVVFSKSCSSSPSFIWTTQPSTQTCDDEYLLPSSVEPSTSPAFRLEA